MSAERGSARRRASDSRRGARPTRSSRGPARSDQRDGDRVRRLALRDERRDRAVGPLGQRVHGAEASAAASRSSRRLAFSSWSTVALATEARADVAVDAGVDRAVLLAGAARDRADQRAALLAQALALLVGGLACGRDGAEAGSWRSSSR